MSGKDYGAELESMRKQLVELEDERKELQRRLAISERLAQDYDERIVELDSDNQRLVHRIALQQSDNRVLARHLQDERQLRMRAQERIDHLLSITYDISNTTQPVVIEFPEYKSTTQRMEVVDFFPTEGQAEYVDDAHSQVYYEPEPTMPPTPIRNSQSQYVQPPHNIHTNQPPYVPPTPPQHSLVHQKFIQPQVPSQVRNVYHPEPEYNYPPTQLFSNPNTNPPVAYENSVTNYTPPAPVAPVPIVPTTYTTPVSIPQGTRATRFAATKPAPKPQPKQSVVQVNPNPRPTYYSGGPSAATALDFPYHEIPTEQQRAAIFAHQHKNIYAVPTKA
eukprot:NODE_4563_length_1148_cov_47.484878_g4045_i0.p1 GENE.NODE_4563_length_1148_cov_47.484878_g4045_i0~~NODE_4563_length_1148_cov_47.484878_g4045_i0.p1  ORF type:complete len:348 (-),score=100.91 NODE_4563_length_1148_cov_47.484878_g4045_i0:105-1106(-)